MANGSTDPVEEVRRLLRKVETTSDAVRQSADEATKAGASASESAERATRAAETASVHADAVRQLIESAKKPEVDSGERLRRSFQSLWVGGTLGAFFAALVATLPDAARQRHSPVDLEATLDLTLRYGYLIWLLAYFFVSNLLNEDARRADKWDVWFDVIQSAGALTAAWYLGFLSPKDGFATQALPPALVASNVVIACICLLSLLLFRGDKSGVNGYRLAGLVVALASLAIWWPLKLSGFAAICATAVWFAVLAVLLAAYIWRRVRLLNPRRAPVSPTAR